MDRTQRAWTRSSATGAIGRRRPMFGTARARRRTLPLVAFAVLVGVPGLLAVVVDRGSPPASAEEAPDAGVAPLATASGDAAPATAVDARPPTFARHDGLDLRLPADTVLLVGFHEASQAAARAMRPVGTLRDNANVTRFDPPPNDAAGPDYVVMSSRGRFPAATSAVDVLLRDDEPVLAPVSGVVSDVRPYHLYGRHPDHRIELTPIGRPDLRVVLIHVRDVEVGIGDTVTAGVSVLAASANRFSFGSHIDRYTEPDRWPHVHIEVKRLEPDQAGRASG